MTATASGFPEPASPAPIDALPRWKTDFPGTELLRSARLRLRGLKFGDIPALTRLNADVDVQRHLLDASPTRFFELAALVSLTNQIYAAHPGLGIWHAADANDAFVGTFSLMPVEASDAVEIGVRLVPEAWGQWYALEGGRLLCRHAFARLGLASLVGFYAPANRVVALILRRLGFQPDGEIEHFGKPAMRYRLSAQRWSERTSEIAALA
jgi:RimJ/RimL family protein N-acetyltransferase